MKINEVLKILNEYAPLKLSSEYVNKFNAYDNSGIIVDTQSEITGIVFSLDLTKKAIDVAIKNGANLIFTHHPAIYAPIKSIETDSPICYAISNKIAVISFHLNLDMAKEGIDNYLALGLGAEKITILQPLEDKNTGYGRLYKVNSQPFHSVVERYEKVFNSNKVITYGNLNEEVNTVASFCGSGLDDSTIELANSAELLISSEIKHHVILKALSSGKKLMSVTHYSCENYGFKRVYESLKGKFKGINLLYNEEEIYL
ncbi:MAG: Nif3-like dinuclear metal center hexameric protein [Clostridia bacterium]|nr:Nif3-like dinuclear metal center hexameric protein [Clostridia bacterium]